MYCRYTAAVACAAIPTHYCQKCNAYYCAAHAEWHNGIVGAEPFERAEPIKESSESD